MIYFLTASKIPVIKIGYSAFPPNRLSNCSVWSPVLLQLAAIDEAGDGLTEAELLYRFRANRSHGEWFHATAELLAVVNATKDASSTPGGWYAPGAWRRSVTSAPRGPSLDMLASEFGLTRNDIRRITSCPTVAWYGRFGMPLGHVPIVVDHLVAAGAVKDHLDFFARTAPQTRQAA